MIISIRRSPRGHFLQRHYRESVFGFSYGLNRGSPFIEYTGEGSDGITYRIVMSENDVIKATKAMAKAKESV